MGKLPRASFVLLATLLLPACRPAAGTAKPSIVFTEIPPFGPGGADRTERIAGKVTGAAANHQVVLFARSGTWWVQPMSAKPYTKIEQNQSFSSETHLGTEYAALLVGPGYAAPKTTDKMPEIRGEVFAVATARPEVPIQLNDTGPKFLQFSGYEWEVVQVPTDSGGVMHPNLPENAWTDRNGFLHLRITRQGDKWACAEVALTRPLGYGSYTFVVREHPKLEPGTVLGLFTWDPLESGQNHREIDIELSQWGDPASKNSQFAVQPYYVPANVFRFNSPAGALTHSFRWKPASLSFETRRTGGAAIAEHTFTSGVPTPGGERVHLNLYTFGKSRTEQQNGIEVVIEKFEYLP